MKTTCIIKVGGAHLEDTEYLTALAGYIAYRKNAGHQVVLVHGGGKEISAWHKRLDLPFYKKEGLRVTPPESMDLVTMILCGLVNKRLVAHMNRMGLKAVGVSGVDFGMLQAPLRDEREYGRVGDSPVVQVEPLKHMLDAGDLVVLAPVCAGPDGDPVNVNADTTAQAVAVALKAENLEFVTDVPAVRTDEGEESTLPSHEIPQLIEQSIVQGGMIPKLTAGIAALRGGVHHVFVGNLNSLQQGAATEVFLA
ncbi:MAG: acetylglutamate kinase [Deltaproteobacteria bacterium]|nr:MAG: acetylglutamate kinase [Deltaproteobacteria bacterium]